MDQHKINEIVDPAIATAESILNYSINPSPTLRGTAAKYLIDTMGSLAGYKGAPIRKMHNLLKRLIPSTDYPMHWAPLEYGPEEELADLVKWVLRETPYMRSNEAAYFVRRLIKIIHEMYGGIPPQRLFKAYRTLTRVDPSYVAPPNLFAQFEEHLSLFEQLERMDQEHRHKLYLEQARKLFNTPPKGHA